MPDSAPPTPQSASEAGRFLTPSHWLDAAVQLLIEEGIDQVKVQRLAAVLKASRGSFYWHFRNREELLDAILQRWLENNTDALIAALGPAERSLEERLLGLFTLWMERHPVYPRFDNAVRAWAAKSAKARRVQRRADRQRLQHLERLFLDAGFPPAEARVRGDVLYFTQVGYYALDLEETRAERLAKLELYYRAFTGRELPKAAAAAYRRVETARQAG